MADETPNGLPANLALSEIGQTGLRRFSGYVLEEYLPEIGGMRWRTVAKEMLHDPVISAMLFAVEMLVRQVKWNFVPSDADKTEETKKFVEGAIFDDMNLSWSELVAQMLSMVPWGFAWFEVVFKMRNGPQPVAAFLPDGSTAGSQGKDLPQEVAGSKFNDGKIGFRKWAIRSQDTVLRWEFDENGGIRALAQLSPPHYRISTIPIEKSLLFRLSTQKNDPEGGRGMLRKVYRAWYFKTKLENLEGIGIERDSAGIPYGTLPAEYMVSDAPVELKAIFTEMKKIVTGIKNDEQAGIVLPSDRDEHGNPLFEIKLLGTAGTKQFDIGKSIERWDQRILMTLMGDFLKMGHEKVGSFAMAGAKINLFQTAIGSFLDSIADVVNRHAIPKLLRLNSIPEEQAPTLEHGDVEPLDLEQVGQFIRDTTGINVDMKLLLGYLLKRAGVPIPDEEAQPELPDKPEPPAPVLPPGLPPKQLPPGKPTPADKSQKAGELAQGGRPDAEDLWAMRQSFKKAMKGQAAELYIGTDK